MFSDNWLIMPPSVLHRSKLNSSLSNCSPCLSHILINLSLGPPVYSSCPGFPCISSTTRRSFSRATLSSAVRSFAKFLNIVVLIVFFSTGLSPKNSWKLALSILKRVNCLGWLYYLRRENNQALSFFCLSFLLYVIANLCASSLLLWMSFNISFVLSSFIEVVLPGVKISSSFFAIDMVGSFKLSFFKAFIALES